MRVSVVIPTVQGREESLERAVESFAGCEIIIIEGRATCGDAWVDGAALAGGDYICFAADDHEVHSGYVDTMVETIDCGYLPAALVLNPDGSKQSCGGQFFDVCRGSCRDWDPVEWSPTPFVSREQWELVEPHADTLRDLHYCSDMLISRALGEVVCVFRQTAVVTHHNHPVARGAGSTQFDRAVRDGNVYRDWATMLCV